MADRPGLNIGSERQEQGGTENRINEFQFQGYGNERNGLQFPGFGSDPHDTRMRFEGGGYGNLQFEPGSMQELLTSPLVAHDSSIPGYGEFRDQHWHTVQEQSGLTQQFAQHQANTMFLPSVPIVPSQNSSTGTYLGSWAPESRAMSPYGQAEVGTMPSYHSFSQVPGPPSHGPAQNLRQAQATEMPSYHNTSQFPGMPTHGLVQNLGMLPRHPHPDQLHASRGNPRAPHRVIESRGQQHGVYTSHPAPPSVQQHQIQPFSSNGTIENPFSAFAAEYAPYEVQNGKVIRWRRVITGELYTEEELDMYLQMFTTYAQLMERPDMPKGAGEVHKQGEFRAGQEGSRRQTQEHDV